MHPLYGQDETKVALLPTSSPSDVRSLSSTSWRMAFRSKSLWLLPFAILALVLVMLSGPQTLRHRSILERDTYNATLGFERIFVLSLPARTDRRDTFLLAASYAGFDVEWVDGVMSEDVSPKAKPNNWIDANVGPGVLGSWRAHMNVLHKIVHEKIQTALIFEDDADFDIALKQQLSQFATGMRALTSSSQSPYGTDWDLLWLGHTKLGPSDNETNFYIIQNDPTVPPVSHRYGKWLNFHVPEEVKSDNTRLIFKADNGGVGLQAYAVTYEAARKALVALSVIPRDGAVDVSIRNFCKGRFGIPWNCYGPYPTLVGSHRAAGPVSSLSDNNKDTTRKWSTEFTVDVKYSTTMALPALAAGADYIDAQWPEADGSTMRRFLAEDVSGVGGSRQIVLADLPAQSEVH